MGAFRVRDFDEEFLFTALRQGWQVAKRRITAAQRRASRKNLVKARMAKKRQASGKIHSIILMLVVGYFVLMALGMLIATKGLILLPLIVISAIAMTAFPGLRKKFLSFFNRGTLRKARLESMLQLDQLLALNPKEFEETMGSLLRHMGFPKVERVGGAGDLSVDLRGIDRRGASFVAQCKRYGSNHKVGSGEIQQFIGMATVHHRAKRLLYFTTSTYTAPAIDLAKQHSLELFTGEDIVLVASRLNAQSQQKWKHRDMSQDTEKTNDKPR